MRESQSLLLTINRGSSNLKFALFTSDEEPGPVLNGLVARSETAEATPEILTRRLLEQLESHIAGHGLGGIVHRVVHGGERFDRAVRITPKVMDELETLVSLAPNHLPETLQMIEAFARARPETPQVACFDTAFHHALPEVSRTLPVPSAPGLRKYGFHGLSYAFLLSALERTAGNSVARGRVILAHLGNGSSLAAVSAGRCVDTTMGLTPAGGLVMSSRSGDLDPGVVTYLARLRNVTFDQMDDLLTRQSGLLAISGRSANMDELLRVETTDARARLAVDIFCYQLRKGIGALAAALGGLDTLVFAGGIGEHSPEVRTRACAALAFLGVCLDSTRNAENAPVISDSTSRVSVRVIPTDEGLMMAREARGILL